MSASENDRIKASFATALGRGDAADTRVLAQASGVSVGDMLQLARTHDIPVIQDLALSKVLRKMPPGTLLPDRVVQAVATLLDFLVQHEKILEQQSQEQDPAGDRESRK